MARATQAVQLNESDAFQGLTSKQYRFVTLSFSGLSDADAYRGSYDCSGLDLVTIRQKAWVVAHLPYVEAKLKELRLRADRQATLAPTLDRAFVVNGIADIALAGDKDSTRLRAFELLGKTKALNIFTADSDAPKKERTLAELDDDLRKAIAGMRDVTPGDAPAAPATDNPPVMSRKRKPLPPG